MAVLGLREGDGARKHEATLESLLAHRPSRSGFSRFKAFEKAPDSGKPEERAHAERTRGKVRMRMTKNACAFL